ncbi:MAG: cobyrinate a,c-diamide synthase [Magnetococcales bacterium]|nr:cobyrinate a,c-diamide synthase [Magnetococcales bacterium]
MAVTIPRLMVSATRKSSGKTTLTIGLAAAFARRGLSVRPFKKGPDFIDPKWLAMAAGHPCRNLDFFIMGRERVRHRFRQGAAGGELALIEGNHGLFDGQDLEGDDCSAALAAWLEAPVLLVVDCKGLARSVAPLIWGHLNFPGGGVVGGLILNNVASPRQEKRLREVVERYCAVPILGLLPRTSDVVIDERHLGLAPVEERAGLDSRVAAIGRQVAAHVDLDRVLELARRAPAITWGAEDPDPPSPLLGERPRVRVGYAADQAFHFYYPDNLQALADQGVELIPFNLLADRQLPAVDGLFIGGGFPEMFMETLENNRDMLESIRRAAEAGLPIYAECGGLMVLAERLRWGAGSARMAGALPIDVTMEARPQGYGYMEIEGTGETAWPGKGERVACHEFHYSHVTRLGPGARFAYRVRRGTGLDGLHDGLLHHNILASYAHIHAAGSPGWAPFLARFWRQRAGGT